MPSHRRRPTPSRRPLVAGLRKPGVKPSPSPRPRPEESTQESTQESAAESIREELASQEPVGQHAVGPTELAGPVEDRPRPKQRDTGVVKPTTGAAAAPAAKPAEPAAAGATAGGDGKRASRDRSIYLLAAALALVFALIAGFFTWQYVETKALTGNEALSDAVATSQVKQEITTAVETLLSYNYAQIDEHEKAAKQILVTPEVKAEFERLYGDVKKRAPEQKIVLTTKVSYAAVMELDGDKARLLVFVEQVAARDKSEERSTGGGQLTVNAQQQDGKWRIAGLDTYGEIKKPAGDGTSDGG